jgi:hypothetical protein
MFRSFIILVVALALTTTAFALAAGNTVDTSKAGDGSAAVSGYAVTNITYNLNPTTPSLIASVEFDLDDTATNVAASISDNASPTPNETYADSCTNNSGNHWTCTFTGVTVLEAYDLRVIAAQ